MYFCGVFQACFAWEANLCLAFHRLHYRIEHKSYLSTPKPDLRIGILSLKGR